MVAVLEETRSTGLTMKYLMGYNEPWDTHNPAKFMEHAEAAEHWRNYVQPVSEKMGLKLVSPTTGHGLKKRRRKFEWMAGFLKECYTRRNLKENPCDVDKIKIFSVHDYRCKGKLWRQNYKRNGKFHKSLVRSIRKYGRATRGKNWNAYVAERPIWVTETNCNWDTREKVPSDAAT